MKLILCDGYEETFLPDGTLHKVDKNGITTIDYVNGSKVKLVIILRILYIQMEEKLKNFLMVGLKKHFLMEGLKAVSNKFRVSYW